MQKIQTKTECVISGLSPIVLSIQCMENNIENNIVYPLLLVIVSNIIGWCLFIPCWPIYYYY